MSDAGMIVSGSYDYPLVVLSIVIAVLAAYAALDLAGRVRQATGWARAAWIATASIAMGGGIWSMHFIAMLAYIMPMKASYDLGVTLASLALPIVVTWLAFSIVCKKGSGAAVVVGSGLVMGAGIAAMHYTGMAAMRMGVDVRYDPLLVTASVAIALIASVAALWTAFQGTTPLRRLLAAPIMGLAIAGMHYTAMAAATFTMAAGGPRAEPGIDAVGLAAGIAAVTFSILFLALAAASIDRRLARAAVREAEALRESEERFKNLYRLTPLPLHALNEGGEIDYVSNVWLELLGYARQEVLGRTMTAFMTESSAQRCRDEDWPALMTSGDLRQAEYQFLGRDGRRVDCLLSAHVEHDSEGRFVQVLCGLTDVTEHRQAEEQLRQAQKLEAIGQLTGGLAHDFNNLLAAVLANLALLRKRLPQDRKLQQLLDTAVRGAERGAGLTQRMLAFSRRQELRPDDVELPTLVRDMADLLQRSIGPTAEIETRFPLSLPRIRVDANQLELALLNLVVNARDAMPEGGRITISAEETTVTYASEGLAAGRYVCLSVTDTGSGMDAATLAAATEPFFTTKGVGKGTGLGLSMVHGLAAQSGGRLVLKSRPGEGTTAQICLPVATSRLAADVPDLRDDPPEDISVPSLKVLAVDDDALVLLGTVAMLEDLGHEVVEAKSGQEALQAVESGEVDLVVTDQAMPRMTGVQLAEALRDKRPGLPVILASGYAELPQGADPTLPRLSKPFSQQQLAEAIAAVFAATSERKVVAFQRRDAQH
ncbi:MAG: MHYT domain-containing protein [Pararhizobium sp.]